MPDASRRSLNLVAMGELHPLDQCVFCGRKATYPVLKRVVIQSTNAVGQRCADSTSCLRRRRRNKT